MGLGASGYHAKGSRVSSMASLLWDLKVKILKKSPGLCR